jgi:hypothetical protein
MPWLCVSVPLSPTACPRVPSSTHRPAVCSCTRARARAAMAGLALRGADGRFVVGPLLEGRIVETSGTLPPV